MSYHRVQCPPPFRYILPNRRRSLTRSGVGKQRNGSRSGQRSPPERRRAAQDEQRGRQQRGPEVEGAQALSEYQRRRRRCGFRGGGAAAGTGFRRLARESDFCFHRRGRVVGEMMMMVVVVIAG